MLRPYQSREIAALFDYWRSGKRNPLNVWATGSGKSLGIAHATAELCRRRGRVLIIAHRRELLEQNERALRAIAPHLEVGVFSASLKRREVARDVIIAQEQTIINALTQIGRIDTIMADECHLWGTKEGGRARTIYEAGVSVRPGMQLCGWTASPGRMDQGSLVDGPDAYFGGIASQVGVKELIDDAWLSNIHTGHASAIIDTSKAATRNGDFVAADLALAADIDSVTQAVADDVAREMQTRRKAMVFACSVDHAEHLTAALLSRGLSPACVTGQTEKGERRRILEAFAAGEYNAVVNVDVLTTGFDEPGVDLLALVRPTRSTSLHVQIGGRGLRPVYDGGMVAPDSTRDERLDRIAKGPKAAGCLFLDYGGNIARHGPFDAVRYRGKGAKGDGDAPVKVCPKCSRMNATAARECECGHVFPPPEKKANAQASKLAAIGEATEDRWETPEVSYGAHYKENTLGEMRSWLRVDYYSPRMGRIASEFVRIEGLGMVAVRADQWWSDRVGGQAPATTEEAVDFLKSSKNFRREILAIHTKQDGRYRKVTRVDLGPRRARARV